MAVGGNTRLSFILMIAQQGLGVAANILKGQAISLEAEAKATVDPAKKQDLEQSAAKYKVLASVLNAADAGITSFLSN